MTRGLDSTQLGDVCRANSTFGLNTGDVIAGKYRVERVLGIGGMGVVVSARHMQLDSRVAIKLLLPDMITNQDAVGRFAREAKAAVMITSEYVARVFDVGTLDSGMPYIVMEFLEGRDLAAWLEREGPLPIEQAVEFILQACVAVADAHALGIVHRDLKPANLFCVRRSDGQLSIKVLDFGISKLSVPGLTTEPRMSITSPSKVIGSPLYMAPEQTASARHADARSDIWALGVILYELLTGSVPFDGSVATEVGARVASLTPKSPRARRPEVPEGLEKAILRCMEKEPDRRYSNVAELAQALVHFAPTRARAYVERISGIIDAAGLSVTTIERLPQARNADPPAPTLPRVRHVTSRRPGPTRATVWAGVGGFVATAGVALLWPRVTGHNESPATSVVATAAPAPSASEVSAQAAASAASQSTPSSDAGSDPPRAAPPATAHAAPSVAPSKRKSWPPPQRVHRAN